MTDIDTQIEDILELVRTWRYQTLEPRINVVKLKRAEHKMLAEAHKAIKTLLIQSKIDELEMVDDLMDKTFSENEMDYMDDYVASYINSLDKKLTKRKASLKRELNETG